MKSYKFLFITLLILFVGAVVKAQTLKTTWEVQKYDLTANLPQNYTADRDLDVNAKLNLKNVSSRSYSRLTLRISDQAEVSSIKVNNSVADFRKGEENIGGNRKLQRIIVNIPSVQPNATFTVNVTYKLKVKDNSGLKALSPIGSQFLPMSFWYPTPTSWFFTGGADFAPFSVRINSNSNLQAVSAGAQNSYSFDSKLAGQPFFITGRWQKIDSNGVEVFAPIGANTSVNKRAEELAQLASEAKNYVAGLLGGSADFPLKIVTVSRGAGFSSGGVLFIDDSVFQLQKIDAQTAMNISEGIVKIWLGGIIKTNGNGYGVIREGLSRYIATNFLEKKFGREVADIERLRQRTNYSTIINRDSPLTVSSPIDGYYFTSNANKGSMIWRYLDNKSGDEFYNKIKSEAKDGNLQLSEIRESFSGEKKYLDYMLDKVTEMNLLIGLPQKSGGITKVALRNMGDIDADVNIVATLANGQKINSQTTIPAKNFGQVTFNNPNNVVRVEVDADKIYPQNNYADDIAPKEIDENDALVFIKRDFDRQKYDEAEAKAKIVLKIYPNFDDAKILLARSLLAQDKVTEARRYYEEVINEKLPTARSLAWASAGLGEISLKTGQKSQAKLYFDQTIMVDAEYGATLSARNNRNKLGSNSTIASDINAFFDNFDKAVTANDKSKIDAAILSGEISRFASNVAGQAQQWTTNIIHADRLDENSVLVETNLNIKLLNRNNESGLAVFRLTKLGSEWKLSGVEIFEVR